MPVGNLIYTIFDGNMQYSYHFIGKNLYEAAKLCSSNYVKGSLVYDNKKAIKFVVANLPTRSNFEFWLPYVKIRRNSKNYVWLKPPFQQPNQGVPCFGYTYSSLYRFSPTRSRRRCNYITPFVCQSTNSSNLSIGTPYPTMPDITQMQTTLTPRSTSSNLYQLNNLGLILAAAGLLCFLLVLLLLGILCRYKWKITSQKQALINNESAPAKRSSHLDENTTEPTRAGGSYVQNVFTLKPKTREHGEEGYYSIRTNLQSEVPRIDEVVYNDVAPQIRPAAKKAFYINSN
ncbi:uncharacterized protein LOC143456715 isoform X2 [Clavelina lepadiformis]|uniref:uncharacterized protein LOC143456715 isoform X2 n=1 Tax=Clavelina lepadiformis TaxID=159417 RepID=UPI0040420C1A